MTRFLGTVIAALAIAAGSFSGPVGGAPAVTVRVTRLEAPSNEASGPAIATTDIGDTAPRIEHPPASQPITAAVTAPSRSITAVVTAPSSPTNVQALIFGVTFSADVSGLDAGDFTLGGTAPGCTVGDPIGSSVFYAIPVTGCDSGTVDLTLGANSIVHEGGSGPAVDTTSRGVAIDRTPPTVSRIFLSADSVPAGTAVTVTATADDDIGLASAQGRVAGGSWATLTAIDGALDWLTEGLTGTLSAPGAAGTYAICVRAIDVLGNRSDGAECVTLTVTTSSPPPVPAVTAN